MRVLQVIEQFRLGGGELHAVNLARELRCRGFACQVMGAAAPRKLDIDLQDRTLLCGRRGPGGLWVWLNAVATLARDGSEFDVIHVHGARLLLAVAAAKELGNMKARVLFTHHLRRAPRAASLVVGALNRLQATAIGLTAEKAEQWRRLGVSPGQVAVCPLFPSQVQVEDIRSPTGHSSSVGLTYVGRLSPVKRPLIFLNALAKVHRILSPKQSVRGIVAGDGRLAAAVRDTVKRFHEDPRLDDLHVSLLGFVQEISEVYGRTDVIVHPSQEEFLPMAVIEAQACGIPVVGFDIPGLREVVVNGETGFLCGNEEELVRRTVELARDKGLREKLGRRARVEASKRFSRSTVVDRLVGLYRGDMMRERVEAERQRI